MTENRVMIGLTDKEKVIWNDYGCLDNARTCSAAW